MQGVFTISLDFELHWGVFDKRNRQQREACYRNTLQLIPQMLQLFEASEVRVTWAAVGSLFAKDLEEWKQLKPAIEPSYALEQYSAYKWVQQHGILPQQYGAHFAPQSIAAILQHPGQELATHTFSHYYCLEQQQEPGAFEADLAAAKKAALLFDTPMSSLVFPRNQYNPACLKTCFAQGITAVRSNPVNWFWSPVSNNGSGLVRKMARTADAYAQIGGQRTSYPLQAIEVKPGEPLLLPASRLLRPWQPGYRLLNKWRLRRLCRELRIAAVRKECYHLWWHPENFGDHPEENMEDLRIIVAQFGQCKNKYGMTSWNMRDYTERLLVHNEVNSTHRHADPVCY
jgi:hypothetical protein